MLDVALEHATRGLYVLPIIEGGRVPAVGGWPHKATTDQAAVRKMWSEHDPTFGVDRERNYNVGIFTGKFGDGSQALLVIDVDDKNGKNGSAELEALDMLYGVPETLTARTPSGGRHLIYSVPEPLKSAADVLARGLDTRSGGGYIVAVGSVIGDKAYTWLNDAPIAPAPAWMIERVGKTAERRTAQVIELLDTPISIKRAIDYLTNHAPVAIEGAHGDETTFKVAAAVKDQGVSELTALELIAEHYNPRCSPPWDYEHLAVKVNNAYHYGTKTIGAHAVDVADFEPVEEPFPDPVAPPPRTVDDLGVEELWDFDEQALEPYRYLIGNFACRGYVTALVSAPAVGKSVFTLTAALAVASDRSDLLDMKVHEHGPALIINNEDDNRDLRKRAAALRRLADIGRCPVFIKGGALNPIKIAKGADGRTVLRHGDVGLLTEFIKARGIALVVFDPLVEFHDAEENDNGQMAAVMSIFRRIAEETRCAVVVVHHTRKPPAGEANAHRGVLDTARGAGSFGGNVRRAFTLFGMDEDEARNLGVDPRRRHRYVVLDDAKGNHVERTPDARWFFKESIRIANGEEVVALRAVRPDELSDRRADPAGVLAAELLAISDETLEATISLNDAARRLVARPMFSDRAGKHGEPTAAFRETVQQLLGDGVRTGDFLVQAVEKRVSGSQAKWWIEVSKIEETGAKNDPE